MSPWVIINILSLFLFSFSLTALSEELSNRQRAGVTSIRNGKAAGICLLIVLFSVGLFFDNVHNTGSTGLPFDINSPREPVPEVVPFGGGKRGYVIRPH